MLTPGEVLARPPFRGRLLIDGDWRDAAAGATMERRSPAHEQLVSVYAKAASADAEMAIAAARRAFDKGPWPRMKGAERAAVLRAVADAILARKQEFAQLETLENGKPVAQALAEIEATTRSARQRSGSCYATRSAW
jgi:acyl-CoA reductase-like NAD-dependent aldehyde dehydrogenase